jgi:hypothetical protein
MILFLLCSLPTLYEAWTDRKGETRKGKLKDTVWLLIAVTVAAAGTWYWLGYNLLAVPAAVLIWRVCWLDYLVNAFLKRYSESHSHINIWKYSGKTAKWDRMVSKVHPALRLVIRVALFAGAVYLFVVG